MDFYKRLNYSLGNEDWSVEEQALRIAPGDKVVCVTASGDRPLHLLMTDCAEIISIDMNSIQNYLLELKLIAISYLDFETYLAFLGCEPSPHRLSIFSQLRSHLSIEAATYWEKNKKMIKQGILYQGMVERLTFLGARFFKLLGRKKVETLLSFTNIDEQRAYVAKKWDTFTLRHIFGVLLNSNVLKYVINDPGLNSYIDLSIRPGDYIYQRMQRYLTTGLANKSALLQLIIKGKVSPDAYFPYMTFEGYSKIRRNIHRLNYQTGNIIEFLNNHTPSQIDCFSMSDIASYMPQEVFERLLQGIYNAAKPKARICLREFMSKRYIPAHLTNSIQRDKMLEQKLEQEESNFVYRFIVGEVHK